MRLIYFVSINNIRPWHMNQRTRNKGGTWPWHSEWPTFLESENKAGTVLPTVPNIIK